MLVIVLPVFVQRGIIHADKVTALYTQHGHGL